MVLQKFQMCDPSHQKQFQYCCIKDNRVFCQKCWLKMQHFRQCQSTRCGSYQKLAHLVINRALELKNLYYVQNMASSFEQFDKSRIIFLQLNYQITELMREWVEQKIPLFLWSMTNQMLHSKFSEHVGLNCNKYDAMCTQMLKAIKTPEENKKFEVLQNVVTSFLTVNHEVDGCVNGLKAQEKEGWKGRKDDKIEEVIEYCKRHLGLLIVNCKSSMKQLIQGQMSKMLSSFDQSIKFRGVSFPKISLSQTQGLFKKKQLYKAMSLNTQLFSKLENSNTELYNGFRLSIPQLQQNPQQLLHLQKSFIKQKLFSLYQSIQTFKSTYPYKASYVIATCLQPDEEYQTTVLQLQKAYIKSIETKSRYPFLNSLSIVIMGPEMIVVKFVNRPEFCYVMKVYNYKKQREGYYKKVREVLDLNGLKQRPMPEDEKHIGFSSGQMSSLQLAYAWFRIAYEQIFIGDNHQDKIFQGQKVAANRGMQLLQQVIEKWKSRAKIQLQFAMPKQQVMQMIV